MAAENDIFRMEFDFDLFNVYDKADRPLGRYAVDPGHVSFEITAELAGKILSVADAYARLVAEDRKVSKDAEYFLEHADGTGANLTYGMDAVPSHAFVVANGFLNLDTVRVVGADPAFDPRWMQVVVWSNGEGITFRNLSTDGLEIAFGSTAQDLREFLGRSPASDAENASGPSRFRG